jgi:uncharacterized Zn finger protein (UPF0148 family)
MADLVISCPQCGKRLRLRDRSRLGRQGQCPNCQHRFVLQEPEPADVSSADDVDTFSTGRPLDAPQSATASASPGDSASEFDISQFESFASSQERHSGLAKLEKFSSRHAKHRRAMFVCSGLLLAATAILLVMMQLTRTSPRRNVSGQSSVERDTELAHKTVGEVSVANDAPTADVHRVAGEPLTLLLVPAGASLVVNIRPAQLWQPESVGTEVRTCLGTLGAWAEGELRRICRHEPADIDEAMICLHFGPLGSPSKISAVVRLVEPRQREVLLQTLQATQIDEFDIPIYANGDKAYLIKDEKTFAVGPRILADEMIDSLQIASPTASGIEQVLEHSDRAHHLTVVFQPAELRRHAAYVFAQPASVLVDQLLNWLGDDVEAVLWSLQLGEQFHSECLLRNQRAIAATQLQAAIQEKLDTLPATVLAVVGGMHPLAAGRRRVVGRFPAMIKVVSLSTLLDAGQRYVRLTTRLPQRAAPNLALAAMLCGLESLRTQSSDTKPISTTTRADPPDRVADRLKRSIEIDFRRTPLHEAIAYIAEESGVRFQIDGDALKLAGYTKNMPQTLQLGTVRATQALSSILRQYDEMVLVVDEDEGVVSLTTREVASDQGLKPYALEP